MSTARRTQTRNSNHHSRHPGVRKQLEEVMDSVRGLGTETKHMAEEQMGRARSSMNGYVRQGKKRAAAMEKSFEDRIRDEPVKALLIASGIGFLCGLVFRHR